MGDNCVWQQVEQYREIARLEAEVDTLKSQFMRDSRALELLENDPRQAERVARERYLMKREGEDVYLFVTPSDSI